MSIAFLREWTLCGYIYLYIATSERPKVESLSTDS